MVDRGLERKDLEEIFTGFEKRQDEKLSALEGRMDLKLKGVEDRIDLKFKGLEERVVNQFHIISEGSMDHIKLLAEGHVGIVERLDRMEKENERQHLETRALIKLSFSELDRRLSDLESQMKEMREWKKQIEARFPI
jgi:hypothetical protein